MLDKITLILLLPFYGLWKVLLSKNNFVNKKTFQMLLLKLTFLNSIILWAFLYNEATAFWLKIICAALFLLGLTFFSSKRIRNVVYDGSKRKWEGDKMSQYYHGIIFSILFFISLIFTEAKLVMSLLTASNLLQLMFLVGFEFPDESPKKKEEKKVKKNWLEDIIPPVPVGSN